MSSLKEMILRVKTGEPLNSDITFISTALSKKKNGSSKEHRESLFLNLMAPNNKNQKSNVSIQKQEDSKQSLSKNVSFVNENQRRDSSTTVIIEKTVRVKLEASGSVNNGIFIVDFTDISKLKGDNDKLKIPENNQTNNSRKAVNATLTPWNSKTPEIDCKLQPIEKWRKLSVHVEREADQLDILNVSSSCAASTLITALHTIFVSVANSL